MKTTQKFKQKYIFILLNLPNGDFILMSTQNLFAIYKTLLDAQAESLAIKMDTPKVVKTKILEMTHDELGTLFNEIVDIIVKKNGLHLAKIVYRENIDQYIIQEKIEDEK